MAVERRRTMAGERDNVLRCDWANKLGREWSKGGLTEGRVEEDLRLCKTYETFHKKKMRFIMSILIAKAIADKNRQKTGSPAWRASLACQPPLQVVFALHGLGSGASMWAAGCGMNLPNRKRRMRQIPPLSVVQSAGADDASWGKGGCLV